MYFVTEGHLEVRMYVQDDLKKSASKRASQDQTHRVSLSALEWTEAAAATATAGGGAGAGPECPPSSPQVTTAGGAPKWINSWPWWQQPEEQPQSDRPTGDSWGDDGEDAGEGAGVSPLWSRVGRRAG
jgi:hypothetical protein